MPFTLTQFTAVSAATGAQLDNNNKLLGSVAPMPCTVSGTNALTLTAQTSGSGSVSTSIAITAYANYMIFCGIAAQTNTAATTAQYGALAALPVYKAGPSGPVALAGGEIVAGCAICLVYDLALNGGNGGFHLNATTAIVGGTISPALARLSTGLQIGATVNPTISNVLNGGGTLAFTALVPNATQEQTFTLAGVSLTDRMLWSFPQPVSTGLIMAGYVIAAGTVHATLGVRMANVTAASTITPGTITVGAAAFRLV